jgi:hypothetical protein
MKRNRAGEKYGMVTLLEPTNEKNSCGIIIWKAKCDCGKIIFISSFSHLKTGKIKSCGCFQKSGNHRRKSIPVLTSAKDSFRRYKDGGLTLEEFYELSQQDCFYCGRKPSNKNNVSYKNVSTLQKETGVFIYNGLDRIDSSKKHSKDNVVPCCKLCNQAKMNLSIKDFLNLIESIYNNKEKIKTLL